MKYLICLVLLISTLDSLANANPVKEALSNFESLKKHLEQEVSSLSKEDKERAMALKDSVFNNVGSKIGKLSGVDSKQLAQSMLPYVAQHMRYDMIDELSHKSIYNQNYKSLVENVCSKVRGQLSGSYNLYQQVAHEDKSNLEDGFVKNWLETLEVCEVVSQRKDLSKYLRKELKQKHPGVGGAFKQMFSCFGGPDCENMFRKMDNRD